MRFSSPVDRALAGWAIAIVSAILLALLALGLINRIVYNPAGQVSHYLSAVRDGNGERALGILGATVPDSNPAMLDGEALRASLANLEDLKVGDTEITDSGEKATVKVSYSLHGEPQTTDFHLSKVGSHWGVFDQWHIDSKQLPVIRVSSPAVSAATLNNSKVAVDGGAQDFAVFYPGEYKATYESALYQSEPQTVQVNDPDSEAQEVKINLTPSEAAQTSVAYQIKAQLDECATKNSLFPSGCPFEYSFDGRVQGDVKWTIEKYPDPKAKLSGSKWVLPDSQGVAKVSFTQLDLYTGESSQVNETVKFAYTGKLEPTENEILVKPVSP